jgi:hypothetical protein
LKYLKLVVLWLVIFSNMQNWRFLNSDLFFKYLEKKIINKIKEPPNTGVYKCSMEIKSEAADTIMKGWDWHRSDIINKDQTEELIEFFIKKLCYSLWKQNWQDGSMV